MDMTNNNSFSIIVPTYFEAKNIAELVRRIAQTHFGAAVFEVILMDDNSGDGIEDVVRQLQPQYPWLRLIIRKGKKGLSEAILDGFKQAKYPIWIIMDADLSHPPEKIPEMLALLTQPNVEIVIGSRYIAGGSSDEKWPWFRKALSRLAALIARVLIAVPVKDPLSGFVALKRDTLHTAEKLEPIGWKIGLEIMVKGKCKHIREVPIHFAQRTQGESKLSFKVIMNYLHHVHRLMWFKFLNIM